MSEWISKRKGKSKSTVLDSCSSSESSSDSIPEVKLKRGQSCLAKYYEDGEWDGKYYDVEILKVLDPKRVKVLYTEYDDEATVMVSDLSLYDDVSDNEGDYNGQEGGETDDSSGEEGDKSIIKLNKRKWLATGSKQKQKQLKFERNRQSISEDNNSRYSYNDQVNRMSCYKSSADVKNHLRVMGSSSSKMQSRDLDYYEYKEPDLEMFSGNITKQSNKSPKISTKTRNTKTIEKGKDGNKEGTIKKRTGGAGTKKKSGSLFAGQVLHYLENTSRLEDDYVFTNDKDLEKPKFWDVKPTNPKIPVILDKKAKNFIIPANIAQYLREYQKEGVKFLYKLYEEGHGGILADDMGLGKTVQVIAFLTALFKKTNTAQDLKCARENKKANLAGKVVLVVCPCSVMSNWRREFNTWGHFKLGVVEKSDQVRKVFEMAGDAELDIVIISYNLISKNVGEANLVSWDCCVFDEVHQLKNPKSQLYKNLSTLKNKKRFGLSGTVIQNSLTDLWAVSEFVYKGIFNDLKTFKNKFADFIKQGQSFDTTVRERSSGHRAANELCNITKTYIIRRTKNNELQKELPKKNDMVVLCKLSSRQKSAYNRLAGSYAFQLIIHHREDCTCGSGKQRGNCCYKHHKETDVPWSYYLFPAMHCLKKLSNHLCMLHPDPRRETNKDKEKTALTQELCQSAFPSKKPSFLDSCLTDLEDSGKIKVLLKLLELWKKDKDKAKVLIFSYSTQMLDILEACMQDQKHKYTRLDGTTPNKVRQDIVDEFNTNDRMFVFLLSTGAGGTGLNITSANKVVIFDPHWNPTQDLQAQDRAYRIGQRREVNIYRLISSMSIEELVYARQIYKQQLAGIGSGENMHPKRYYNGVQGGKCGELFGIENMFVWAYCRSLTCNTIKRTEELEQEYAILENQLDMSKLNTNKGIAAAAADDDDDEIVDDGEDLLDLINEMQQATDENEDQQPNLSDNNNNNNNNNNNEENSQEIHSDENSKNKNCSKVSDLLDDIGVEIVQPQKVIGSSRLEKEITDRAEFLVRNNQNTQEMAIVEYTDYADKEREEKEKIVSKNASKRKASASLHVTFRKMAKHFDYDSNLQFAEKVDKMKQVELEELLEKFYEDND